MVLFTEIVGLIPTLRSQLGEACVAGEVRATLGAMSDAEVLAVLTEATEAARVVEQLRLIASGVVAARSAREAGHTGLAQTQGHRNAVSLIQDVTGVGRAEAARTVRVGQSLLADTMQNEETGADAGESDAAYAAIAPAPWHAPLGRALLAGAHCWRARSPPRSTTRSARGWENRRSARKQRCTRSGRSLPSSWPRRRSIARSRN